MHLFNYKDYDGVDIGHIIANNIVYILGAKIVGGKAVWKEFEDLMVTQLENLMNTKLVDDDQTLMLLATIMKPAIFEFHRIPDHQLGHDPFVMFSQFNNEV